MTIDADGAPLMAATTAADALDVTSVNLLKAVIPPMRVKSMAVAQQRVIAR